MISWIVQNREILKIIYGLAISLICLIIVLRTNKLFQLSFHQGIRYFRNAFFFYGIAFFVRYILDTPLLYKYFGVIGTGFDFLFEYFIVMGGFFLLYSLLWKRLESRRKIYFSSLANPKIALFYVMTVIIAFMDSLWHTYSVMFFSQIILFIILSVVSYINYSNNGSQHKFLKFYFFAMILSLVAWILNAVTALLFGWNQSILMSVYIINAIIFLVFLFGVLILTKTKN